MTAIHITIVPEKRDGIFGPAHALAEIEAPVRALREALDDLKATVTVTFGDAEPAPPARRARRSKAEIEAAKIPVMPALHRAAQ